MKSGKKHDTSLYPKNNKIKTSRGNWIPKILRNFAQVLIKPKLKHKATSQNCKTQISITTNTLSSSRRARPVIPKMGSVNHLGFAKHFQRGCKRNLVYDSLLDKLVSQIYI